MIEPIDIESRAVAVPLCKDCRHFIADPAGPFSAQCQKTARPNPVDGATYRDNCSSVRVTPGRCGPLGMWFEEQSYANT